MNVVSRVRRRSGVLTFDPAVDGEEGEDLRLKWIADLDLHADSVIDYGCWTGASLASIAASRRVGLDIPGPWIDRARQRLPGAEIMAVDSFESLLPGLADMFDVALFLDTLEHIPRHTQERVLASIYSSLCEGGTLILTTPAAGLAALLDPAWSLVGHRHYRAATLRHLLRGAGFVDIQIRFSGNIFSSLDIVSMYVKKHLLHRHHVPSQRMRDRLDTGLQWQRRLDTAAVWAICRRR